MHALHKHTTQYITQAYYTAHYTNIQVFTVWYQDLQYKSVFQLLSLHSLILSLSVQLGGWSTEGLQVSGSWGDGSTQVVCESTHLTSFAILVDYSGLVAVSLPPCSAI